MQNLADIEFTDDDFTLLKRGLDRLAQNQRDESLMSALMTSLVEENIPAQIRPEYTKKKEELEAEKIKKRGELNEEITILQYKLIQLKRYIKWASETPAQPSESIKEAPCEAPRSQQVA